MASVLEIIPLGGIGEFGMNCMALRYGDEMLILDAGMGFPEESAYGVDVSIPNFGFLDEYRDAIVQRCQTFWPPRIARSVTTTFLA